MPSILVPYMPFSWSVAALFVRMVMGVAFVLHGHPKIQHPFSWMGTHSLTIPFGGGALPVPPWLQAIVAGVEFFGGWALLFGVLTRVAAALLCMDMIVAFLFSELPRHSAFVASGHDMEPNLIYMVLGFLFFFIGPGALSLDALLLVPKRQVKR